MIISGNHFANCINLFHKTEVRTVILRCLVCRNLNWIKSYNIILNNNKKKIARLKINDFRANFRKWVLTPHKETSCRIFKMANFSEFFDDFMSHIDRLDRFFFKLFNNNNHLSNDFGFVTFECTLRICSLLFEGTYRCCNRYQVFHLFQH